MKNDKWKMENASVLLTSAFRLPPSAYCLPPALDAHETPLYTFRYFTMTKTNGSSTKECAGVERLAEANLPTESGVFRIVAFKSRLDGEEFPVLVKGELDAETPTLVRIHSQCLTGDVFHSLKCDCGRQLDHAMKLIQEEGRGVIIYQQQEGRGIGITNKIRAYELQDAGQDTVEANLSLGFDADLRQYECCVDILKQLGLRRVRMMSNNPDKIAALTAAGFEVQRVPIEVESDEKTLDYLKTKKEKLGHMFGAVDPK
jgi:3,4-dihydroxy 2-butanone 4-phosphate synthase / GTP cyclohydrolase II